MGITLLNDRDYTTIFICYMYMSYKFIYDNTLPPQQIPQGVRGPVLKVIFICKLKRRVGQVCDIPEYFQVYWRLL